MSAISYTDFVYFDEIRSRGKKNINGVVIFPGDKGWEVGGWKRKERNRERLTIPWHKLTATEEAGSPLTYPL